MAEPIAPRVESTHARRKRYRFLVVIVIVALLVAEGGHRFGLLATLENIYTDLWHRVSGVRYAPAHVALVVVDDQSLAQHSDEPLVFWTPLFARSEATLRDAGASVVGIDFLFSITPENWIRKLNLPQTEGLQNYDLKFRQELNAGKVVLVGAVSRGEPGNPDMLLLPHSDYLLSLPNFDLVSNVGLADLVTDRDGGVRRFEVAPRVSLPKDLAAGAPRLTLGPLLALRAAGLDMGAGEWQVGARALRADTVGTISYSGPPGTIQRVPISRVLADGASADPAIRALKGKVVIVGGDFQGMNDVHFTPYSSGLVGTSGGLMSGAEIQANIVATLLSGNATQPLPDWARWLLLLALIVPAVFLFQRFSPWVGLGVFAAGAAISLALKFAAFQAFWLAPAADLQLGLLSAYVMSYGGRLTREERERARVRHIFGRYVSDNVVDLLLQSGKLPDMGGVSMRLTIMFSDIRNFTSISEKLDAHEVVEFLNKYFDRVCQPVLEQGGTIDKYIGDAVMVQFGAPVAFADHAQRALRAAVGMRAEIDDFRKWMQERFAGRNLPEFGIGIGLHTGDAVVGNLGCAKRIEFTVIGDTVNVASRLEGETKNMGCIIVASADTVAAAGAIVRTGRRETLTVKGRAEPVDAFEIVDVER